MKQRKIAFSLAVLGAIAAPFVFRTYKMDPVLWRVVPYTTEEKEKAAAYVANHCERITEDMPQPPVLPSSVEEWARWGICIGPVQDLKRGGPDVSFCRVAWRPDIDCYRCTGWLSRHAASHDDRGQGCADGAL